MQIIHNLSEFEIDWSSSVLTLGVFDGMHLGHQALIRRTLERAADTSSKRVLVTYHPHPDLVLGKRKDSLGTELFTYEEKLGLLQSFDLDYTVFLEFTKELAATTAEAYLRDILVNKLKASCIVIGYDQAFGKDRQGDYEFLQSKADQYKYIVDRIEPVLYENEVVSSSKIRKLIHAGNVLQATKLLGKHFYVTGTVVRGFHRGHSIGFPTANLDISATKVIPANGVYRGWCERGGKYYRAMMNIGFNPTFENKLLSVEAHILDFGEDLYGEQIRIHFYDKLRDEQKFDGIDALKAQLNKDKEVTLQMPVELTM